MSSLSTAVASLLVTTSTSYMTITPKATFTTTDIQAEVTLAAEENAEMNAAVINPEIEAIEAQFVVVTISRVFLKTAPVPTINPWPMATQGPVYENRVKKLFKRNISGREGDDTECYGPVVNDVPRIPHRVPWKFQATRWFRKNMDHEKIAKESESSTTTTTPDVSNGEL
ncbi:hypothetical protein SEUCBS139899_007574 [Sporothrix eucalyptigena]|uniref:Uncharacterized protein n=1 Tax=Sporothrix eucalyptigena TaxID=1812306 RepID=A0ABP0C256_9PEZI